ncbi:polysaccharide deacetylase family protein [Priestia taiwanensis]|uniref:polysaccharide deacetylase family protein n=1 Tax=Priestia taiwanensis TaxID=1347902 RepID=UPI003570D45A
MRLRIIGYTVLLMLLIQGESSLAYMSTMKTDDSTKSAVPLYEEIKKHAATYEIPPENARIDKIWKAVPGYNGQTVDVDATHKKMKAGGKFDPKKVVVKQVPPSVHLKDLSPAPIFKGNGQKKMVAFTINVAWGNEYLPSMLKTLKENNAHATFFLEGRWVKKFPHLAKMIVEAGQEVGNHSYTHPNMTALSSSQLHEELTKTNDVIKAITNKDVKWFAPPSGTHNEEVIKKVKQMGMETIMWTADTIDWKKPSRDVLIERVMKKVEPGTIVLMHPTEATDSALKELIQQIREKGYDVVNISTLLNEERVN